MRLADFHIDGINPSQTADALKIEHKGRYNTAAFSRSSQAEILSGPADEWSLDERLDCWTSAMLFM